MVVKARVVALKFAPRIVIAAQKPRKSRFDGVSSAFLGEFSLSSLSSLGKPPENLLETTAETRRANVLVVQGGFRQ